MARPRSDNGPSGADRSNGGGDSWDSDRTAFSLSEILTGRGASKNASLGGLLRRASLLAQLENRIAGALHADLAEHMRVANVRDGRLVLLASSPAWATRLRMHSRQVLDILHAAGLTEVDRVEVRVVPPSEWPSG